MSAVVIERMPLLHFARDLSKGEGWILDMDGEHYTDAQAAELVEGFAFAGYSRFGGFVASDSRERVLSYSAFVETGASLAKRLSPAGDCPDFVTASAESHLNDGWDPESVRSNPDEVGPFLDAGEVADRMNELAGEAGS